jgi:hypothetical protein
MEIKILNTIIFRCYDVGYGGSCFTCLPRMKMKTIYSGLLILSLVACGGGGGGGSAGSGSSGSGSNTENTPAFVANNETDKAFFSNSYEISDSGYIQNTLGSTGVGGREKYESSGGAYIVEKGNAIFNIGLVKDMNPLIDMWLISPTPSYRNLGAGYLASAWDAGDVVSLNSIHAINLEGRPFSDFLPSMVLKFGTVSGTFPAGSTAYEAQLTSVQDIYLEPNVGGFEPGILDDQHFYNFHHTPDTAVCIGDSDALVFTGPTQAIQYRALSQPGMACVADTNSTVATLTVSSRMFGSNRRIFEFGNATTNVTDYDGVLFNFKGTKALRFYLDIEGGAPFGVSQNVVFRPGYFFQSGSTGTRLIASGLRLNKTALNAVLRAKGQPEI